MCYSYVRIQIYDFILRYVQTSFISKSYVKHNKHYQRSFQFM